MINNLLPSVSEIGLPPKTYEAVIRARNLLSAFAWDATGHYHLGGFAGLLFGFAASIVASQSRAIQRDVLHQLDAKYPIGGSSPPNEQRVSVGVEPIEDVFELSVKHDQGDSR